MNNKQRVHAILEGRPIDRTPVTSLYNFLYYQDHFSQLTGKPKWEVRKWQLAEPQEHLSLYRQMVEAAPFEILQPQPGVSREYRQAIDFVEKDGRMHQYNRVTDELTPFDVSATDGHATKSTANETQVVFNEKDAVDRIRIARAEDVIATGINDYTTVVVAEFGIFPV